MYRLKVTTIYDDLTKPNYLISNA